MNKKLSHALFAAILAIATLIPMFPQSASAQSNNRDAQRQLAMRNQFLLRTHVLTGVLLRGVTELGTDRVLFLTAGALGIPVATLQAELAGFGVSFENLIIAELMARSSNVPVSFIIDLINSGRDFGQVALQINAPFKLTLFRFASFANVINAELATTSSGSSGNVSNQAQVATATGIMKIFNNRMLLVETVLGDQAFEQVLLHRLMIETGMDIATLNNMHSRLLTMNPTLTFGDFAIFVLADNTLTAAVRVGLEVNDTVIITPGGIVSRMGDSNIPINLFLNRLLIIQRAVNQDANNG